MRIRKLTIYHILIGAQQHAISIRIYCPIHPLHAKEFPQEHELKEKLQKLDEINAELKINDNSHEMLGDEKEEKEDKVPNKKSPERC